MFFPINSSLLTTFLLGICTLFYKSFKTAAFSILFSPRSQGHEWCLCCAYFAHGQRGGPTLRGGIGYGRREWRVGEWKLVWNKTFICSLRSPQMPSFCLSWLSSHLCGTFWNWVNHQLWGMRYRFLCDCQVSGGINYPKGETSSIGNGRQRAK